MVEYIFIILIIFIISNDSVFYFLKWKRIFFFSTIKYTIKYNFFNFKSILKKFLIFKFELY